MAEQEDGWWKKTSEFIGYSEKDNKLGQSKYDFTYRVFPKDIGNSDVGHYVVFNINVPVRPFTGGRRTYFNPSPGTLLPDEVSKVDTLRFSDIESFGGYQGGVPTLARKRFTRRIKESIALHMPLPLAYVSQNQYKDVGVTSLLGGVVGGVASDAFSIFSTLSGLGTAGNLLPDTSRGAGEFAGAAPAMAGYPIKPNTETIYVDTTMRQFLFEFRLHPRNEKEADTIQEIVKTFRFYSAPEIGWGQLTWIPPAEFDITFYNKGSENMKIPRINTCVLNRCELQVAANEVYSTFRTGHPTQMNLILGFQEVEVIHKLRVLQGF